jgi:SLT domain-containing protein
MSAAVKKGLPQEWVPLLSEIVKRESSFNPNAKNPNSSAYGYGQFLSSTRQQYEKKTGLSYDDPVNQLVMMGQYVKDRYGTPAKALAFWKKNHWY